MRGCRRKRELSMPSWPRPGWRLIERLCRGEGWASGVAGDGRWGVVRLALPGCLCGHVDLCGTVVLRSVGWLRPHGKTADAPYSRLGRRL